MEQGVRGSLGCGVWGVNVGESDDGNRFSQIRMWVGEIFGARWFWAVVWRGSGGAQGGAMGYVEGGFWPKGGGVELIKSGLSGFIEMIWTRFGAFMKRGGVEFGERDVWGVMMVEYGRWPMGLWAFRGAGRCPGLC